VLFATTVERVVWCNQRTVHSCASEWSLSTHTVHGSTHSYRGRRSSRRWCVSMIAASCPWDKKCKWHERRVWIHTNRRAIGYAIIAAVKRELCSSSGDIAWELGLLHLRIIGVFHDDLLHPYDFSRNTYLLAADSPPSLQLSEWLHQHSTDELLSHHKS